MSYIDCYLVPVPRANKAADERGQPPMSTATSSMQQAHAQHHHRIAWPQRLLREGETVVMSNAE